MFPSFPAELLDRTQVATIQTEAEHISRTIHLFKQTLDCIFVNKGLT